MKFFVLFLFRILKFDPSTWVLRWKTDQIPKQWYEFTQTSQLSSNCTSASQMHLKAIESKDKEFNLILKVN